MACGQRRVTELGACLGRLFQPARGAQQGPQMQAEQGLHQGEVTPSAEAGGLGEVPPAHESAWLSEGRLRVRNGKFATPGCFEFRVRMGPGRHLWVRTWIVCYRLRQPANAPEPCKEATALNQRQQCPQLHCTVSRVMSPLPQQLMEAAMLPAC